jgi:hypothetical protein
VGELREHDKGVRMSFGRTVVGVSNGIAAWVAGAAMCLAAGDSVDLMTTLGPLATGPGRARAADLAPRLIGNEIFHWDGGPEVGLGWMSAVVTEGEYVEAKNIDGWLTRVIVCAVGNAAGRSAVAAAVVYEDDGPGGGPGTLLRMSEGTRIPGPNTAIDCSDITIPAIERHGRTFVGVWWNPMQDQGFFVAADTSLGTPIRDMYGRGKTGSGPGTWGLVRNNNPDVRALGIGVRVISMAQATAPCFDSSSRLCLNQGDVLVEVDFRRPNDQEGLGIDSGLRTDDSGILWFFNASNLEMLIKVLNACGVNNRYWVFYAATTNVEFHVVVIDTRTGEVWTSFNPLGRAAPPVQDTDALKMSCQA